MEFIIETSGLTKKFGKDTAVSGLNMKVPKGEVYGFLGPNGAGKTTTIRMLLGLMKPTSGTIHIFQKDLQKERISILKRVGSLVEQPSYYPHLTGYENLEAIRKILGVPEKRIAAVLELVGLSDAAHKKVKGYSLGMKQRLGIAASLLHDPELLILDEPTNGLDPSGMKEVRNLLKRLAEEEGKTIVISSHLLSEIDQVATTVGVLLKGKLIFQDSIAAMRKQAQQKIKLRVSDGEEAWRTLLSRGMKVDFKEGAVFLENASDEKAAEAVAVLVENGFAVYRVEEQKSSLEEIFLQMTKGERDK